MAYLRQRGLGLGPGDACVDPEHPWYLPNFMHTNFECKCMAAEGRSVDDLCVFAASGGTPPFDYVRPSNVPSVGQIAVETPGYLAGSVLTGGANVLGGTAAGLFQSVSLGGLALAGGLGFLAYKIFVARN